MEQYIKYGELYCNSREHANEIINALETAGYAVCRLGQNPEDTSFIIMKDTGVNTPKE